MAKTFLTIAAISGLLAVALGAFGAHGLKARISGDLLAVYQTGVQYHFYHTLALALSGVLLLHWPRAGGLVWSGWLLLAGMLVFSGSLYLLALTGQRWLGAITPLGGLSLMAGWLVMAVSLFRHTGH